MISPSQLSALQGLAAKQFATSFTVRRTTYGSDVLGDDATDPAPATIGTFKGWLHSAPTAEASLDGGAALVTSNTYQLGCAVGTDIRPRDFVTIGANTYVVTDTTADETWPVMLNVSLRLRE
jgi:hypothetical protein